MSEEKQNTEQLRAQAALLLSQARAQSMEIQWVLSTLTGENPLKSRLASAAAHVADVASTLAQALGSSSFPLHGADLMALGDIVHSGEASALVNEATAQAGTTTTPTAMLTDASADTRREVQSLEHDMFDRKIFDPYLHFSSPADEAAYRQHQAEDQKYVDAQLARHTPEGDLNAGGGMIDSMLNADAHGAGDSPEFMPRWNALVDKTMHQHAAMRAAGQSTAEFDNRLMASVRSFLKAKGLSDTEIDQRLAGSANPLDAVEPFLKNDRDSQSLLEKLDQKPEAVGSKYCIQPLPCVGAGVTVPTQDAQLSIDFAAVAAKLNANGVPTADAAEDTPAHGLTIAKPSAKAGQGVGG
jgi:hypothetical protein